MIFSCQVTHTRLDVTGPREAVFIARAVLLHDWPRALSLIDSLPPLAYAIASHIIADVRLEALRRMLSTYRPLPLTAIASALRLDGDGREWLLSSGARVDERGHVISDDTLLRVDCIVRGNTDVTHGTFR